MDDFIIKYWLQVLFGAVLTVLGFCTKRITTNLKKEMVDQKSIKAGVQAILRDRLIQSYNKHTVLGYCEIHDRDNIVNLYDQYHALGANGVMDSLIDEVLALPVRNCRPIMEEEWDE